MKKIIGIIGGHLANTNSDAVLASEKMGKLLADRGFVVATGGEDGIMESACKGAKSKDGLTMAIMKGNQKSSANPYSDIVIPTSLDLAFMNVLVWSCEAIIAFDGRYGTLCEIGLTLDIGRPLLLIGKHSLLNSDDIKDRPFLHIKEITDKNLEIGVDFIEHSLTKFI